MKFYVGKIDERLGEIELSTTIRFKLDDHESPIIYLDDIAQNWRLEYAEWDESYNGYDHGDGICVNPGSHKEVTPETYSDLDGIITEL